MQDACSISVPLLAVRSCNRQTAVSPESQLCAAAEAAERSRKARLAELSAAEEEEADKAEATRIPTEAEFEALLKQIEEIGRASCRERV